jgi:hypothetical protein
MFVTLQKFKECGTKNFFQLHSSALNILTIDNVWQNSWQFWLLNKYQPNHVTLLEGMQRNKKKFFNL